jgi:hypothetical protein
MIELNSTNLCNYCYQHPFRIQFDTYTWDLGECFRIFDYLGKREMNYNHLDHLEKIQIMKIKLNYH